MSASSYYLKSGPDLPYTESRGRQFLSLVTQDNLEAMQNFELRDGDVVTIGYPKTGTHWIRTIVRQILHEKRERCDEDVDFVLEHTYPGRPPCHVELQEVASPRLMHTFLSRDLAPPGLARPSQKIKVLVMLRNPKDICISYYRWSQHVNYLKTPQSWETFQGDFLCGNVQRGSYYDHALGWWQMKDDRHFLFIKYEDLRKRMFSSVKKIAVFLNKPLSDAEAEFVIKSCSFETPIEPGKKLARIKRKGVVGDWKNNFTEPQSEAFDKHSKEKLKGSGLEFEYE
ncbi:sulfotransferase 1B1-like [Branchiostoma lanceolatum]|uniref:sulfotransferase 1B1-like n=1 Tax=Branchiostoma lanceolatum TaxID=7740 RepID=UPI00345572A4